MSTDTNGRAAAIAALTATLNAGLAKDEAVALRTVVPHPAGDGITDDAAPNTGRLAWSATSEVNEEGTPVHWVVSDPDPAAVAEAMGLERGTGPAVARHIARNDPARKLRDVRAGRDLLAAILAERHDYNPSDEFYSCSQAVGDDPDPNVSLARGSGCSDPDRAGQPCDCGRDARVERLLRILAGVYEDGNTDERA
jgi:Family of unknown function (DUF6221)